MWACLCGINPFFNKIHALFCCFFLHLLPVNLRLVWNLHSLTSMLTVVFLMSWWCGVNGWCYCLNDISSLVPPSDESISPSPSQSFVPQVQIEKVNHAKDSEGGDQSASIPCTEIHAVALRRCSEPLSYIPQHHQTKPPLETETHLVITSEQRSLICFTQTVFQFSGTGGRHWLAFIWLLKLVTAFRFPGEKKTMAGICSL